MAKVQFDIGSLYTKAFGIGRGQPYQGDQANKVTVATVGEGGYQTPENRDAEGTEFVNMRATVQAANVTGRPFFMPVRLGGVLLPNEPTISLNLKKRIEETALVGSTRKGTVKELISVEDWAITLRGIAINQQSKKVYPEDQVKALNDLFARNEAIQIESALTNLLGIYRIVLKEFDLTEMVGVQHAQAYQFLAVSDEDFILEF